MLFSVWVFKSLFPGADYNFMRGWLPASWIHISSQCFKNEVTIGTEFRGDEINTMAMDPCP